jgi:hypothetical protein
MILSLFVFSNAFMSCIWRCSVKSKRSIAFSFAACLLLIAIPISAHHGTSGYDMEKVITLNGTVTSFNWSNPHCLIHIDVKDSEGFTQARRRSHRRDSSRQERRNYGPERGFDGSAEVRGQRPCAPFPLKNTSPNLEGD